MCPIRVYSTLWSVPCIINLVQPHSISVLRVGDHGVLHHVSVLSFDASFLYSEEAMDHIRREVIQWAGIYSLRGSSAKQLGS